MFELIVEGIVYFVAEVLFKGVHLTVKYLGLLFMKICTLSPKPMKELKEKYEESLRPAFFGYLIVFGLFLYFIINGDT